MLLWCIASGGRKVSEFNRFVPVFKKMMIKLLLSDLVKVSASLICFLFVCFLLKHKHK